MTSFSLQSSSPGVQLPFQLPPRLHALLKGFSWDPPQSHHHGLFDVYVFKTCDDSFERGEKKKSPGVRSGEFGVAPARRCSRPGAVWCWGFVSRRVAMSFPVAILASSCALNEVVSLCRHDGWSDSGKNSQWTIPFALKDVINMNLAFDCRSFFGLDDV